MERKTLYFIFGAVAVLVVAGFLAAPKFLPKDSVVLDQTTPPGHLSDDPEGEPSRVVVQRSGTWQDGDSAHRAAGAIDLVSVDGEPYLRFTDFSMTSGPDVYLYLTPSSDPQSRADVETDGVRVPVITDEDRDARLNERGTFFVALDGMDLDGYHGVAAWCDDFNVLFGNAALA